MTKIFCHTPDNAPFSTTDLQVIDTKINEAFSSYAPNITIQQDMAQSLHTWIVYYAATGNELNKDVETFKKNLAEVRRILDTNMNSSNQQMLNEIQFSESSVKRFYLAEPNGEQYVTQRELQCFKWLIKGKTADETAIILNISKRTVDVHCNNLKRKLDCVKLTQLAYKLALAGVDEVLGLV